jgi:hypothetical protein
VRKSHLEIKKLRKLRNLKNKKLRNLHCISFFGTVFRKKMQLLLANQNSEIISCILLSKKQNIPPIYLNGEGEYLFQQLSNMFTHVNILFFLLEHIKIIHIY